MNLPNKLTVLRILLVPVFSALLMFSFIPHNFLFALIVFIFTAYTDYLDGKIARRDNLITDFGKIMDPLADKIMVISALICFVALDLTNVWFVILIMFREFGVTSIRLVASGSGVVIPANIWGKLKTVTQIIAIIVIITLSYAGQLISLGILPSFAEYEFTFYIIGEAFMLISVFTSIYSGIIYALQNKDFFKHT